MSRISLIRRVRRHGLWNTLKWAALRFMAAALGVRVLRGLVLESAPAETEVPGGLEQGFQTARALRRFASDPANEMSPFFIADAVARGDRCYAICNGPMPVFTSWYSRRPTSIGLHGLVAHFDPSYVYMYKAYTQPEHRGQRLYQAALSRVFPHYAAKGAKGFLSYVEATNFPSMTALQRMGYRVFGSIYVMRLFGRNFTFASADCRQFGFRLETRAPRRAARPRLQPAQAAA
jgi:GNAT superfamily N-acetyltransferase